MAVIHKSCRPVLNILPNQYGNDPPGKTLAPQKGYHSLTIGNYLGGVSIGDATASAERYQEKGWSELTLAVSTSDQAFMHSH